jgi:hypothetical protein
MPLADAEFVLVDRGLARLRERLKALIELEYLGRGPSNEKARSIGLSRIEYRTRLYGAQWALYMQLGEHVDAWMARIDRCTSHAADEAGEPREASRAIK